MGCRELEGDNSQNDHLCPLSGGDILSRDLSDTKEPAKKRCEARFFTRKKTEKIKLQRPGSNKSLRLFVS